MFTSSDKFFWGLTCSSAHVECKFDYLTEHFLLEIRKSLTIYKFVHKNFSPKTSCEHVGCRIDNHLENFPLKIGKTLEFWFFFLILFHKVVFQTRRLQFWHDSPKLFFTRSQKFVDSKSEKKCRIINIKILQILLIKMFFQTRGMHLRQPCWVFFRFNSEFFSLKVRKIYKFFVFFSLFSPKMFFWTRGMQFWYLSKVFGPNVWKNFKF